MARARGIGGREANRVYEKSLAGKSKSGKSFARLRQLPMTVNCKRLWSAQHGGCFRVRVYGFFIFRATSLSLSLSFTDYRRRLIRRTRRDHRV